MNLHSSNHACYMKTSKVKEFVTKYRSSKLPDILLLNTHQGEFDIYYSVEDLKPLFTDEFFRDMESSITTHVIEKQYLITKFTKSL